MAFRPSTSTTARMLVVFLGTLFLLVSLTELTAEGKKRRTRAYSPLKILEVTTSPSPFLVGQDILEFSIRVMLPKNLKGSNVLEVNSLISFPSKRSVRFLSHRLPIGSPSEVQGNSTFTATLVWDGKDQSQQLVQPGQYEYEIRAKLMADEGVGPRTRMISLRARGTITVSVPKQLEQEQKVDSVIEAIDQEPDADQDGIITEEASVEEEVSDSKDEDTPVLQQESEEEELDMEEEGLVPTEELVAPLKD